MTGTISPAEAAQIVQADTALVVQEINDFTSQTFRTRGGRLGSGMGSLLEALWVYYMNRYLANEGGEAKNCELAWLEDHQPADFACLIRSADWKPEARDGELFRIEAKSMNVGVDEAKGHFTNLAQETSEFDQLLVIIWSWTDTDSHYLWPRIHDYFIGPMMPIIRLRDELHLARGGSFVDRSACPDGCAPPDCTHHGEPLNASGKRERRTGPKSTRPANVEYAANFGGLLRMIKTNNPAARQAFRKWRREDATAHSYISFIHSHYPQEELNQYSRDEWRHLANLAGVPTAGKPIAAVVDELRNEQPDYQSLLRNQY